MSEFWNLYRDGVTQGLLSKFLTCPEKFRLIYGKGYGITRGPSYALDVGTLFHKVKDHIYGYAAANPEGLETYDAVSEAVSFVDSHLTQREEEHFTKSSEPWVVEADRFTHYVVSSLVEQYFELWSGDFKVRKWVAVEKCFSVTYVLPSGKSTQVRGKWDGIFEDENGDWWLFESKSKGRINEEQIADSVALDLQVMTYLWAIWKTYGKMPVGCMYNVVRRPQLRKSVRRKETDEEFLLRIKEDIVGRPNHYFVRFHAVLLPSDIRSWQRNVLDGVMSQLELWWEGNYHYRNLLACQSTFGMCEFARWCRTGQLPHNLELRTEPFPELNEEFQSDENNDAI